MHCFALSLHAYVCVLSTPSCQVKVDFDYYVHVYIAVLLEVCAIGRFTAQLDEQNTGSHAGSKCGRGNDKIVNTIFTHASLVLKARMNNKYKKFLKYELRIVNFENTGLC